MTVVLPDLGIMVDLELAVPANKGKAKKLRLL
jgi:hypothetical protein